MVKSSTFSAVALLSGFLVTACSSASEDVGDAEDGTQTPLVSTPEGEVIAGQYIVVFKDDAGASAMNAAMERIARAGSGNRVEHTYRIIPGFAARLDDAVHQELLQNPDVAYIEQDQVARINANYRSPADGIDRTDQRMLPRDENYNDHDRPGDGVEIYIVDTGIHTNHAEFSGRIAPSAGHFSTGTSYQDCNGHGTHVASAAAGAQYGMAKDATLHAVRVLGCDGSGSYTDVIAGVDFVTGNCGGRPCVANMSLGGGVLFGAE